MNVFMPQDLSIFGHYPDYPRNLLYTVPIPLNSADYRSLLYVYMKKSQEQLLGSVYVSQFCSLMETCLGVATVAIKLFDSFLQSILDNKEEHSITLQGMVLLTSLLPRTLLRSCDSDPPLPACSSERPVNLRYSCFTWYMQNAH